MSREYEEMQVEKWVNLEDVAEHLSISQQDTLLTHEGVAQGMSPTATSVFFGLENWTIHLEP